MSFEVKLQKVEGIKAISNVKRKTTGGISFQTLLLYLSFLENYSRLLLQNSIQRKKAGIPAFFKI